MNILFEDWDGSQMPRSKIKNAGVVSERYAGPTMALDRLIGGMDVAMAHALEKRLDTLLTRSNARAKRRGQLESRLSRGAAEMAKEPREFEGFVRVVPHFAQGIKDSTVGSFLGLPQAPYVTASLVVSGSGCPLAAGTPPLVAASTPAHVGGGTHPRWRRRQRQSSSGSSVGGGDGIGSGGGGGGGSGGGDDDGWCCRLCLPLTAATRMRPIATLRVEVFAMDRAFGDTLLGSAEVQFVVQPSAPTTLRMPIRVLSSVYSYSYVEKTTTSAVNSAANVILFGVPAPSPQEAAAAAAATFSAATSSSSSSSSSASSSSWSSSGTEVLGFLEVEVEVVADSGAAAGLDSLSFGGSSSLCPPLVWCPGGADENSLLPPPPSPLSPSPPAAASNASQKKRNTEDGGCAANSTGGGGEESQAGSSTHDNGSVAEGGGGSSPEEEEGWGGAAGSGPPGGKPGTLAEFLPCAPLGGAWVSCHGLPLATHKGASTPRPEPPAKPPTRRRSSGGGFGFGGSCGGGGGGDFSGGVYSGESHRHPRRSGGEGAGAGRGGLGEETQSGGGGGKGSGSSCSGGGDGGGGGGGGFTKVFDGFEGGDEDPTIPPPDQGDGSGMRGLD